MTLLLMTITRAEYTVGKKHFIACPFLSKAIIRNFYKMPASSVLSSSMATAVFFTPLLLVVFVQHYCHIFSWTNTVIFCRHLIPGLLFVWLCIQSWPKGGRKYKDDKVSSMFVEPIQP